MPSPTTALLGLPSSIFKTLPHSIFTALPHSIFTSLPSTLFVPKPTHSQTSRTRKAAKTSRPLIPTSKVKATHQKTSHKPTPTAPGTVTKTLQPPSPTTTTPTTRPSSHSTSSSSPAAGAAVGHHGAHSHGGGANNHLDIILPVVLVVFVVLVIIAVLVFCIWRRRRRRSRVDRNKEASVNDDVSWNSDLDRMTGQPGAGPSRGMEQVPAAIPVVMQPARTQRYYGPRERAAEMSADSGTGVAPLEATAAGVTSGILPETVPLVSQPDVPTPPRETYAGPSSQRDMPLAATSQPQEQPSILHRGRPVSTSVSMTPDDIRDGYPRAPQRGLPTPTTNIPQQRGVGGALLEPPAAEDSRPGSSSGSSYSIPPAAAAAAYSSAGPEGQDWPFHAGSATYDASHDGSFAGNNRADHSLQTPRDQPSSGYRPLPTSVIEDMVRRPAAEHESENLVQVQREAMIAAVRASESSTGSPAMAESRAGYRPLPTSARKDMVARPAAEQEPRDPVQAPSGEMIAAVRASESSTRSPAMAESSTGPRPLPTSAREDMPRHPVGEQGPQRPVQAPRDEALPTSSSPEGSGAGFRPVPTPVLEEVVRRARGTSDPYDPHQPPPAGPARNQPGAAYSTGAGTLSNEATLAPARESRARGISIPNKPVSARDASESGVSTASFQTPNEYPQEDDGWGDGSVTPSAVDETSRPDTAGGAADRAALDQAMRWPNDAWWSPRRPSDAALQQEPTSFAAHHQEPLPSARPTRAETWESETSATSEQSFRIPRRPVGSFSSK